MGVTPSTMRDLGTALPRFRLPDYDGRMISESDFKNAPALLVAFICPHCPFVKHIRDEFAHFARDYQARGLAIVAINSNDTQQFPDDNPAGMKNEAATVGYTFPYLFDESQAMAKAFEAACTPDLFLYDRQRHLVYRGQFDDSRPGKDTPVTGGDLRAAADAVLAGAPVSGLQRPSAGCNIKWKAGNAPVYFVHG
jgi:peroxiredoxin